MTASCIAVGPSRPRRAALILTAAGIGLILMACSGRGSSSGRGPSPAVERSAAASSPIPAEPQPGQPNPRPRPWQEALIGSDDRTLQVIYHNYETCYPTSVLDHIEVAYETESVVVTVFVSHPRPPPGEIRCGAVSFRVIASVQLTEAIAGREIVDGARTDTG